MPGLGVARSTIAGGGVMGDGDVQSIKKDLGEVKESLCDLNKAVGDLRVLVAGNYVTRTDFTEYQKTEEGRVVALHQKIDEHKKEEQENAFKLAGIVFAVSAFVFGILQWAVQLTSNGKVMTP